VYARARVRVCMYVRACTRLPACAHAWARVRVCTGCRQQPHVRTAGLYPLSTSDCAAYKQSTCSASTLVDFCRCSHARFLGGALGATIAAAKQAQGASFACNEPSISSRGGLTCAISQWVRGPDDADGGAVGKCPRDGGGLGLRSHLAGAVRSAQQASATACSSKRSDLRSRTCSDGRGLYPPSSKTRRVSRATSCRSLRRSFACDTCCISPSPVCKRHGAIVSCAQEDAPAVPAADSCLRRHGAVRNRRLGVV
jgi:hypothetical protein